MRDLYEEENWLRNPSESICYHQESENGKKSPRDLLLLSLVVSAPLDRAARDAIRRGWSRPARRRKDLALAFLVGAPDPANATARETLSALLEESEETGDLLLSGMVDSYRNMTLKTLAGMQWARE